MKETKIDSPLPWRSDIDGLRAVAVLSIIFYHFFPTILQGGFVGVDIFFVISGYLISGILLRDIKQRKFVLVDFYVKRIRRIFPALLLILSFSLVLGTYTLSPPQLHKLGMHVIGGALFSSNFLLWNESGYFDQISSAKPLLHLWSLAIEEQYYLFWPLFLCLADLRNRLGWFIGVATLISFAVGMAMIGTDPVGAFYSPVACLWELSLGGVLVWLEFSFCDDIPLTAKKWAFLSLKDQNKSRKDALGIFGLTLILISLFALDSHKQFPGLWAVPPTFGALAIIAAGPDSWLNRHVLSQSFLVWIGAISYPLYLWHWPILYFLGIVNGGEASTNWRVASIVIVFLMSWLTYRFVERPIRSGALNYRVARILFLLMAFIACVGFLVMRNSEKVQANIVNSKLMQREAELSWFSADAECLKLMGWEQEAKDAGDAIFCSVSGQSNHFGVAIIGDSTANSWFPGLAKRYGKLGIGVINLGNGTCAPFHGLRGTFPWNRKCEEVNARIYQYLIRNKEIKTVIISFAPWDIRNMDIEGLPKNGSLSERFEVMKSLVKIDVSALIRAGKHVVVTFDTPHIGVDPRSCMGRTDQCTISHDAIDSRMQPYVNNWKGLFKEQGNICIFAQDGLFRAENGDYVVTQSGHSLFRDDHHLSYLGSDVVVNAYFNSVCLDEGAHAAQVPKKIEH